MDISTNELISQLVPLTTARWETARTRAEELVRGRIKAPLKAQFTVTDSEYPQSLIVAVLALMVIVAMAAFYISAGKEIMAGDMISAILATASVRISPAYVSGVLVAILLLGECGALLFGLAARIFGQRRIVLVFLRVCQGGCVLIAMMSNATVTLAYPVVAAMVFDWFITLAAPALVIGIGLIIEELIASWLLVRQQAIDNYNRAMANWRQAVDDPAKHPDFNRIWGESILEQLIGASKHNRETIPALIDETPQIRAVIVSREYQRHQWGFDPSTAIDVSAQFQSFMHVSVNRPQTAINSVNNVSGVSGNTKQPSPSEQLAIDWLMANPDKISEPNRTVAIEAGMSPTIIYRAQRIIKARQS